MPDAEGFTRDQALAQFGTIDWVSYGRTGILSEADVSALKTAEDAPLDYSLGDHTAARNYVRTLLKVVSQVSDVAAQQYALTKLEDILLAEDCGPLASRVAYFLSDEGALDTAPFMRSLTHTGNGYCAKVAASVLATLLTARPEVSCEAFVSWLCEQLSSSRSAHSDVKAAVPALTILLRATKARDMFAQHGGVGYLTKLLKRPTASSGEQQQQQMAMPAAGAAAAAARINPNGATAQLLYELTFCLWTLSFSEAVVKDFVVNQTVDALCEQITSAPREKVVRVSLAALSNLCHHAADQTQNDSPAARMIKSGLMKTLRTLKERPWADPDIMTDVETVSKVLQRNYRDLSTFERYVAEVESGDLQWGLVHSDKFWRENARSADSADFALIKKLIALLNSDEPRVVAIACFDIGEFVRFYPNGKLVIKHLGAKQKIMTLIDHEDADVQRHALQCVSKILVTNWEFVK